MGGKRETPSSAIKIRRGAGNILPECRVQMLSWLHLLVLAGTLVAIPPENLVRDILGNAGNRLNGQKDVRKCA